MNQKNIFFAIIVAASVSYSLSAKAQSGASDLGIFVEPAITYELGETKVNYPAPFSDSTGSSNGLGLGARLGLHVAEIVFVGVDARYSMPQFKDSSVTYDASSTAWNVGPVLGIQTPVVGLRVWASYILGGEMNPSASSGTDVRFDKATGYRVGAGFRMAVVSLNLEYQQLTYGQATLEQVGPFSSTSALSSVNLNNKTWLASVSFPFEL